MKKIFSIVLMASVLATTIFSAIPVFAQDSYVMKVVADGITTYCDDFGEGWVFAVESSEETPTVVTLYRDWYAGDTNCNGVIDADETPGYFKYYNEDDEEYGTINGALTTEQTMHLTLDLNGHTISRNLEKPVANGSVFYINCKTLYITDSSESQTGKITGGYTTEYGGAFFIHNNGVVFIENCEISGNYAQQMGGGIYIQGDKNGLSLNNVKITGNKAEISGGGVSLLPEIGSSNDMETMYIGGDTVIWGNERFDGTQDNLYFKHYEGIYNDAEELYIKQCMGQSSDIPYSPLTENARIGVGSNFNNFLMTCEDSWFDLESYKHFIPDEPNNYYILSYYEGSDKTNLYQLYYIMKGNSEVTTPNIRTVSVKDTNLLKRASIDYENQVITLTAYNNKKNHFNYVSLSSLITYTTSEDVDVVVGRDDICNLLSPRKYRVMGTDQTYILCTVQVVPDGGEWAEVQEEVENDYVMTIDDGERFCAYSDFETGWTEAIPLSKKRPTTVTLLSDWIAPDKDGDGNGDFYYENSSSSEYGTDEGRLHLATDTIEITIDLNGHTISRNLSSPKKHGQVFRIEAGSLTITDSSEAQTGKITGGNNNGDGGAFYITDGSIFVESGEISENKCTGNGAGIYSDEMICISGGKITGNTAGKAGGGVYANKSVYLGGTAVVTGNKQAQNVESNIYLPTNSVNINHTRGQATGIPNRPLTEGANIGITSVDTYDLISGDDSCFDQGSFGYLHADDDHTYYIRSVYDASKGNNAHQLYYNAWSDANARYPHVKSVEVKNTNILKSAELDDIQQYITLKAYKHKKTAFDNISLGSLISCEYDKDTYYIYNMNVPLNLYSGYEYKIMSDNGTYLTCKIIIEWVECSHNDSDENCICDYCGEYTLTEFAITGYNAETKEATVFVPEAGKYTLIFADYEGNKLDSIDIVEHKFTEGINTVQQENKTFMLANGDKVMLWYDLINLVPVCDALTIK